MWHSSTTISVTQSFGNLRSIKCFGILHPKSLLLSPESKLKHVFRFSNQQKDVVLCRQNDGRNPKFFHPFYLFFHPFYLFFHDVFEWRNNENNNIRTICIFLPLRRFDISNFSKSRSAKLEQLLSEISDTIKTYMKSQFFLAF